MHECDAGNEVRASLYALGLLDETESAVFERHLSSCARCTDEVRKSGEMAVDLARVGPTYAAPEGLRQRVLKEAVLPGGVAALVRADRMNWQPTPYSGVSIARLYEDPIRGELATLIRMMPGARYPSHRHHSLEHCYVVEGDVVFEDHALEAGDYSAGSPTRDHSSATTVRGCLLFIVHGMQDQIHAH
jgi:anti-sigma factor ChrR (cupin superfamily)